MAKIKAKWQCSNCGMESWIIYDPLDLNNKLFSCCKCGKVYKKLKEYPKKGNRLECSHLMSISDKIPRGVNRDAGTGQIFFADPDGSGNKTRADYAKKYGWDPLVLYCNAHKDKPICKDFENMCEEENTITLGYDKQIKSDPANS